MFEANIKTAKSICDIFVDIKYVQLIAPMQSGKTSVYCEVARNLILEHKIERVYVISAYNSVALREQTENRLKSIPELKNIEVWFLPNLIKLTKGKNSIDFKMIMDMRRCLLIIDESHIGSNEQSTLHEFFKQAGICPTGKINKELYPDNNLYILSVSATPYAESSLESKYKSIVYHTPGEGYIGLEDLNLIQIDKTSEDSLYEQLYDALVEKVGTETYAIIRQGKSNSKKKSYILKAIENIKYEYGCSVIECNMESSDTKNLITMMGYKVNGKCDMNTLLSYKPTKFTIIVIKDFCKAGQTLDKKYISMVYETAEKADGQAQGLPGRCCGYHGNTDIDVYCYRDLIETHMNWIHNIDTDIAAIPASGHNVKPIKRLGNKRKVDPKYQKFEECTSLEHVRHVYRDFGYSNMPTFDVKEGHQNYSKEEYTLNGFYQQYLPKDGIKVYSLSETKQYLKNQYPLLGSKIELKEGKEYAIVKVAKIVYRNINDPSSIVYLLYSYNGPVIREKDTVLNTVGKATDESMYMYENNVSISHTCINTIIIKDELLSNPEDVKEIILRDANDNRSIIAITQSELNSIDIGSITRKVYNRTVEKCCRIGYISHVIRDVVGNIFEKKHVQVTKPKITNQKDLITYIVQQLCPTYDTRKTGIEIETHPFAIKEWELHGYRGKISTALSNSKNKENYKCVKNGRTNLYYFQ